MTHRYSHIWILLLAVASSVGCGLHHESADDSESLSPERKAAVEAGVRSFVSSVAHDVTQYGPAAWSKYFADEPAFFMADEGQLVFPSSEAAKQAIQNLARVFKSIDLQWGNDLRIDPLTPSLAMVAVPYTEVRIDNQGHRVTETGYFTGLAEFRNCRWQFRDAHWSAVPPASKAP